MMNRFKAVIFDFDGVIVDSEVLSSHAISEALTVAGCPTTPHEAMLRYTGLNRADTLGAIAAIWGDRAPDDIDVRISETADRHFAPGLAPVDGVIQFITETVAHLPKAIGSSSGLDYLNRHVDALGLRESFGTHVYSGRVHVTRGKPHPDIYLHAAQQLGVDPADILILEDSPAGARAALAAGAQVIGLAAASHCTPQGRDALRAAGVPIVLDSYDAVTAHLLTL